MARANQSAGDTKAAVSFYFEQGPDVLQDHPFLSWLTVSVVLLTAMKASWWTVPVARFGRQIVPVAFAIAVIPLAIRFCYDRLVAWYASMPRLFDAPQEKLDGWHALEHRLANDRTRPTAAGLVLLLVAVPALSSMTVKLTLLQSVTDWIFQGFGTFMAGVALYYVAAFSYAIWRLGDFPVTVEHHQAGVRGVGDLMTICWMTAAIIWGAFTSTAVMNPYIRETLPAGADWCWPVFWLCVLPAALIVVSFVVCQLPLHDQMLAYKRRELGEIEGLVGHLLRRMGELTEEEMARVKFLEGRTVAVAKLPEWPFDWKSFLWVSTASISFLFPELAKRVVESHLPEIVKSFAG